MKILIGSESFFPGISGLSVSTDILAKKLSKKGHKVSVVVPSAHLLTSGVFRKNGYKLYRLHSIANPFRKNFRITIFPMNKIKGILNREKPDIIHLQDPNFICQSLKKLGKKMNIPVIGHCHFMLEYILTYIMYLKPLHSQIKNFLSEQLASFYNECSYVITPSDFVAEDLIRRGVKTPVKAVPMGIEFEKFNDNKASASGIKRLRLPDKFKALYLGRIDKDKNLEVFFESIPEILKKIDIHIIICGTGSQLKHFKSLAGKLKIKNNISFIGPFRYTDKMIPLIYKNADIFIMPSAIETQSIVTLEAMGAGLPIVAAKGGAVPEYIKDMKNGILFDPDDPKDLARAVVYLHENRELMESMKRENALFAKEQTIDNTINRIEDIYNLVNGGKNEN
ncbi:MAG: glycosyltransferase [Armatimonadota bacterium]